MTPRYVSPPNWPSPPPGWTPPAGWKPDPTWGPAPKDWKFWQEEQSWFARHKVLSGVAAGGLGMLFLIGAVGGGSNDQSSASAPVASPAAASSQPTPAATSPQRAAASPPATPSPTPPPPARSATGTVQNVPQQQARFVARVQKAQDDAAEADNDLQLGAALSRRDKSLCKIVGTGKVKSWAGTVETLDSNGDGYGILVIKLADGVQVGTWNNALSDFEDDTLIKPGRLLDDLSELEEGQEVSFSGRFVKSGSCVNDKRLTKIGKLNDPEFVFRFSSVVER